MTELSFREMRRAMVSSQLRTTGVSDPRVVAAMGAVSIFLRQLVTTLTPGQTTGRLRDTE